MNLTEMVVLSCLKILIWPSRRQSCPRAIIWRWIELHVFFL